MKKINIIIIMVISLFIISCNETTYPIYELNLEIGVTYMNGDEDIFYFNEDSLFRDEIETYLDEGDLVIRYCPIYDTYKPDQFITHIKTKTLASGVRRYSIKDCDFKLMNYYLKN